MNSTPVPSADRRPWIGAAALALPTLLATLNLVSSLDVTVVDAAGPTGGLLWLINATALLLQEVWGQALEWLVRRVAAGWAEQ
ncbi:MAG TPA: hypothetical protein VF210_06065 [Pseudomonadales bacterium]